MQIWLTNKMNGKSSSKLKRISMIKQPKGLNLIKRPLQHLQHLLPNLQHLLLIVNQAVESNRAASPPHRQVAQAPQALLHQAVLAQLLMVLKIIWFQKSLRRPRNLQASGVLASIQLLWIWTQIWMASRPSSKSSTSHLLTRTISKIKWFQLSQRPVTIRKWTSVHPLNPKLRVVSSDLQL